MIGQLLQQLGFTKKEAEIYLALLRRGKAMPASIAKETGVNRATVYSITKSLIKKGIISEDLGGKTLYLVARPVKDLSHILKKEKEELEKKEEIISSAIGELSIITTNTTYSIPKIRFVEESDIEKHLYDMLPMWAENVAGIDNTIWGFQDHTFVEMYHEWIKKQWGVWPEDIQLKLLTNKSYVENTMRGKYKQRQIKYWDKAGEFTSTIWVTGDYITMLSLRERPHYLVEIHDPVMARNMRALFKGLWEEV